MSQNKIVCKIFRSFFLVTSGIWVQVLAALAAPDSILFPISPEKLTQAPGHYFLLGL